MFNHVELNLPSLEREMIDGVRYYKVPNNNELQKFVSITSVISHFSREKFAKWREKVGEEEANRVTKRATSRGTDAHTLIEHHLLNQELPKVQPISEHLFKIAKPALSRINNIHALEGSLYRQYLGVSGT